MPYTWMKKSPYFMRSVWHRMEDGRQDEVGDLEYKERRGWSHQAAIVGPGIFMPYIPGLNT